MKKIGSILLALLLIIGVTSCKGKEAEGNPEAPKEAPKETAENVAGTGEETDPKEEMRSITDRSGAEYLVPEHPKKIISLSPAVTQVLVDLGMEDTLVAVDKYSLPQISNQDLPTFDIMNPDVEVLANLGGEIVLSTGMSQKGGGEDPLNPLRKLGIEVIYIPVGNTIEEIQQDVIFVGEIVNKKEAAEALVHEMNKTIQEYRVIGESVSPKKTVYFEISSAPSMYSFGSGVYLDEILEIIGAENIFKEETDWISVAPEAVVAANPDVIITNVDYEENAVEEIKNRPGFAETTAVRNDAVILVRNETSSYSNHNIAKGLEEIAKAVYPQEFGK